MLKRNLSDLVNQCCLKYIFVFWPNCFIYNWTNLIKLKGRTFWSLQLKLQLHQHDLYWFNFSIWGNIIIFTWCINGLNRHICSSCGKSSDVSWTEKPTQTRGFKKFWPKLYLTNQLTEIFSFFTRKFSYFDKMKHFIKWH